MLKNQNEYKKHTFTVQIKDGEAAFIIVNEQMFLIFRFQFRKWEFHARVKQKKNPKEYSSNYSEIDFFCKRISYKLLFWLNANNKNEKKKRKNKTQMHIERKNVSFANEKNVF